MNQIMEVWKQVPDLSKDFSPTRSNAMVIIKQVCPSHIKSNVRKLDMFWSFTIFIVPSICFFKLIPVYICTFSLASSVTVFSRNHLHLFCRSTSAVFCRSILMAIVYSDLLFFMTFKNSKTSITTKLMKTN